MKKILGKIFYVTVYLKMLIRSLFWKLFIHESALGIKGMVRVNGRIKIYFPENVYIGQKTTINEGVIIHAMEKVTIGNNVRISPGAIIMTGGINTDITTPKRHIAKPIDIGNDVWIGSGAIILPGVVIGNNSIIAAGAVVTTNVPTNVLVAGVPAIVKKNL